MRTRAAQSRGFPGSSLSVKARWASQGSQKPQVDEQSLHLGARERTGSGEHVKKHQCSPGNGVCFVRSSHGKPCSLRKQQVHPLALQAQNGLHQ